MRKSRVRTNLSISKVPVIADKSRTGIVARANEERS